MTNIESSIHEFTKKPTITQEARQYGLYNKPGQNSGQYGLYSPQNEYINNEIGSNGNYGLQSAPSNGINFMGALESIALHDSLRCIPKLLCEFMVERTRPNYQQSSFIPNIDMSSLLSYIDNIGQGAAESPLLTFGKAAILGYTAKGNNYECTRAYPRCPRDPDQLLDYLNNHNGGFFRFFNGLPNRSQYGKSIKGQIEKRIQNKPSSAAYGSFHSGPQSIKFQNSGYDSNLQGSYYSNSQQTTKFQNYQYYSNNRPKQEYLYVNGRFIPYNPAPSKYYKDSQINTPSYSQVGVVFPDRTGTGELLLDSNKFNSIYSNNKKLKFPYY
ncbi:uncharacterized protein LOC123293335 [Chrysoperla carnea]|uniref:uncharacterized protein LOC123293335 n=1 Tax=Chrysoperla carnea TaxID=189513 RepID=UPI001D081F24|nr:uncharacterized protein LOC123293335 [Chrysoperla carnea]